MKSIVFIACALCAFAGPTSANVCKTDSGKTCATGMPIEGYCMCGDEGGTVASGAAGPMTHHTHPMSTPAAPPAIPPK
jgi:hypothetical protein